MKKETIYLAGGCFWGTEKYMETVPGVLSTRVGYALGKKEGVEQKVWDTVTYEEVCNHSGHAETVEIVFDSSLPTRILNGKMPFATNCPCSATAVWTCTSCGKSRNEV